MKPYQWVLFDADDTLFSFDAYQGLTRLFSNYDIQFTEQDYQTYQAINQSLWLDYQHNKISAQALQEQRFEHWQVKTNISAVKLNQGFLEAMAEVCKPFDGVVELLQFLRQQQIKVGIVTNGFTQLQQIRLDRTNLAQYIDLLVISEQVGVAKPDIGIFTHAFVEMDNPDIKRILMVGDNLDTDILGGIRAGMDTCWYNAKHKQNVSDITPTFEVGSHQELQVVLQAELVLQIESV